MKNILSSLRRWWKLYRYTRYCRHLYRLERKMFMKYIRDGKSASDAKLEARKIVCYLMDIDKWWEEFI